MVVVFGLVLVAGFFITLITFVMCILILTAVVRNEKDIETMCEENRATSNAINEIKVLLKVHTEAVEKALNRHHDKLNVIMKRQWAICEHLNLKHILEDWESGKY